VLFWLGGACVVLAMPYFLLGVLGLLGLLGLLGIVGDVGHDESWRVTQLPPPAGSTHPSHH